MEFIDTNILLYAYDPTAGEKHGAASALIDRLWRERRGAISIQVLQDFYVNATRRARTPAKHDIVTDTLANLTRWRVHSPLPDDVIAAAALSNRHRLSFWDAMIIRSAAELRCETLWTEDLSDGQLIEGVRLANPFARV